MIHMCIDKPSAGAGRLVRDILLDLTCAARCDARVLITGDALGGKRELAGMIHYGSRRAAERFVSVDCAGAPDRLLEAELFGRAGANALTPDRDGRGLLEQADGGTVFLENIGAIGLALQARLLDFLENGRIQRVGAEAPHAIVDVRLISSAEADLFARAEAMTFSEDLFYRLNVMHLVLPAFAAGSEPPQTISH